MPNPQLRPSPDPQTETGPVPPPPKLELRLSVLFYEIAPQLRHDFFGAFQAELREAFPDLPKRSEPHEEFDLAVYRRLEDPVLLPQPLLAALLAIQELAAPENRQLLRRLVEHCRIFPDPAATTAQVALEVWLRRRFACQDLPDLRAEFPPQISAPPDPAEPVRQNQHAGEILFDPQPHPPFPQTSAPDRPPPGDLAALARFPRYKISRLPPAVRETLNRLLRQGVSYAQILLQLGPCATGLNKSNLSRWKKTGYLLWLAEQQRREDALAQLHLLLDLVREQDNGKIHEATQQIAALRISQVLAAFDAQALTLALQQQPQAFVRLIQTLPKLSRGGMDCERLLVELAERKASRKDDMQPDRRGISEESFQYATQKLNLM